ncbi:uncharacterized protein L203_101326 [Cryptococcus depauperatus CBS 7841]|uniref:BRO domain-containing protein 1 n=1 Tax=Cryptococcus depauperatus CBS 7841 TaxID=1295531 RepID=A0A1E3IE36_9TREE|nr:vacuolar protein-sorting protein BRO1 [Cryptococcus depauperatus CBS 7841]
MAFQSPLIAIPKKTTEDVDWATPIRHIIAASYGEDPNTYTEEVSVLQRCRQDAVKGAGSDSTARDLLYKYFGQLELLELRFAEVKVSFSWIDAFTSKTTTQTSLAFEKASIIHLISSILSSLAQSSSRSDSEGLKRAYYHTRAAAGMLTYINENFLHAPSTDLSREVIHFLIGIMMAQATEIFTEKLVDEKKSPALVARSANQTGMLYNTVVDEMKDFQGKGVFDRNWLYVLQIKSKLFSSLAQYYKGTAEIAAGKHGPGLVRLRIADTLVQDVQKQSSSFIYTFTPASTPSLPSDTATSLHEIVKAHVTICREAKDQATKDNDLIYHEVLPSEASLPAIEKLPPAAPITIQEVYGNPDVAKLIGPDIFIRLVPLAVHESASVYSEEKAKLARTEVERTEMSEVEIKTGLEHLHLPEEINRWRKVLEDDSDSEINLSTKLRSLVDSTRDANEVERNLGRLAAEREGCERGFRELSVRLDNESLECEKTRAKYAPQFTQSPSGPQTSNLRSNIAANLSALSSAASSDSHLQTLWQSIHPSIALLSSGISNIERAARVAADGVEKKENPVMSLLDIDEDLGQKKSLGEGEREALKRAVQEGGDKLERLSKIRKERDEVLKDLKEKIQNDDVSNLLLLNRRAQNVEPQLFASELEKFRPYQTRLASAIATSKSVLQELEMLVAQVQKGRGIKEIFRSERQKVERVKNWEQDLIEAGKSFAEIRAGLSKGLGYYDSLKGVMEDLKREVNGFVVTREQERAKLIGEIEMRQRLGASSLGANTSSRGLEDRLAALKMDAPAPPPPPRLSAMSATPSLPSPAQTQGMTPLYPPPPPTKSQNANPYDFASLSGFTAFSPPLPASPPLQNQLSRGQGSYGGSYSPFPTSNTTQPLPPLGQSTSPYPPPPPSRPTPQAYGSYTNPSQPSSLPSYPLPPTQPSYNAFTAQPSYHGQVYGQQGFNQTSQIQAQGYYPSPPSRPTIASPVEPQTHPAYQHPTGYQVSPAPQQPQGSQQGQGHNYTQYGYQHGQGGYGQYR